MKRMNAVHFRKMDIEIYAMSLIVMHCVKAKSVQCSFVLCCESGGKHDTSEALS